MDGTALEVVSDPYERHARESEMLVSNWCGQHALVVPEGAERDLRKQIAAYAQKRVDDDRTTRDANRQDYYKIMGGQTQ